MIKVPENHRSKSINKSTIKLIDASTNIVFIDPKVIDYQSLVAGITLGSEVVILDANRDGLAQITEFLAKRKSNSVQSIHIVSHGSVGSLQLGSINFNLSNLDSYKNQLQKWASALTDKADILIYGCDVASGEGTKFVRQISQITGADVAASTDKTGSTALGGDWDLEVKTGKIEASLAFKPEVIQAYQSILPASFTGTYSQNFNTLAASGTSIAWTNDSTILGWYSTRTNYITGTGSNNTGGLYSFGSANNADRALGSVASGTTGTIYYGLRLQNNTGSTITNLQVGYTGEQWRNGGNTSPQQLKFSYQTGSTLTSLTTGTWTSVTSLDFTGPIATATAGAIDGNQSVNRIVIAPVIFNLPTPIANGEEIILRWEDIDDGSNDHGLAIDDVSVKLNNTTYVVTNTNDSGAGSLRQAIINANNDPGIETIVFDTTGIFGDATPDTITLTSGELNITEGVIIQGTGANKLVISGNNASRIFNASASLLIDGLHITGGNAGNNNGGGIYSTNSVTVSNSIISGNTTNSSGGGIYSSNTTISNSIISGNTANSSGGGIYSTTSATVSNSTLSGNTASYRGGGIYSSNTTISNSTFSGNTANDNGGGIFSSTLLTISNSTISSNTAKISGGGIYTSNATVSNSTIFQNTADSDNNGTGNGGGIFRSGGTVSISNSIIAGNIDRGNQAPDISGINFNGNAYNLIGNLAGKSSGTLGTGTDIINPNPGLKPLGDYGGSTQTHALYFSSPARNAGDPAYNGGLTTDQRGTDFNRIESGRIDIGAFEYVLPKVNFGAATYNTTEDSTATTVTISVTLDASPENAVTVPIVVKNTSTASNGNDYTFSPATISFTAGATGANLTQLITFTINPDDLPENAETVVLNFGTLTGADLGTITETTLNIAANDSIQYAISSTTSNLTEGNSGTQAVTFTVTRSGGIGVASTVNYAFGGAAIFGSDYNNIQVTGGGTAASGTLSFAVGETTKTITADVLGDNTFELNEDIALILSNPNLTTAPANSTITNSSATVNIINDDSQPTISISDVFVTEGTGTTTNASFTISLSNPSSQQISVNYNTSDGTAQAADSDYNSASGTITFNPGETSKTLSIGVLGDNKFETDETFSVNLLGATNATIADNLAVATITNDDSQPTISISDVSIAEGNTGTTTNANFTITLSNASYQQVTVNYNTIDGTAQVADSDYNSASGTITFNPGETSKVISIGVIGDNKAETNETFSVNLLGATNAAIADSLGVANIIDDDNQPTISISDVSVIEDNTGTTTNANFTISLSNPSYQQITVNYNTTDGTAQVADSDYNSASGTITFNPGETSKVISIGVIGDNQTETDETFSVNLSAATNAAIADSLGVGTIINDDNQPTINISDVSVSEGNTGTTSNANFIISLSNPSSQQITVNYNTTDGTAQVGDSDYNSASGTITFNPGETSKILSVGVVGDNKFETDETFSVNLLGATNAAITDSLGVGTIINDDNQPTISISDVSVSEGNTGTTSNANFTISLSNPSYQQVTVNYNTTDGTAQVSNSDYNYDSGTIIFAPGETSKTLSIGVLGDNQTEANETFSVNLSGATNGTIADNLGVATIIDDDNPTTVSISDVSIAEGNTGTTTNANFIVTLSAASLQQVTVNYNTSDGTAKVSDSDYNPASGTIVFNPGETTKTIAIGVIGDNKAETNETFSVNLFGATNTTITDSLGVATIINDDQPPAISIADVSVKEGTTGMTTNANFVVTLSNEFYQPIAVNYSTSDGTAKESDSDYNFGLGTIVFNPGETSKVISIGIRGDNKVESNETFFVNIYGAANATFNNNQGVGTIKNDD
ncbi:Calx-beta domain-containing protein [Nostoc sp. DSM 114167]|jgi:predicted outer membrane repeat protein|uniref:Calx-beta domain-containing protein n=1 Tax=Nostoc sp. DSM 114167 TaxID=3439050 RepID=UPI0040459E4F